MTNQRPEKQWSCQLTGIVLAGGQSSRMGRDKAKVLFRGETLLNRAIHLLQGLPVDKLVVLGREEATYGVRDETPHLGPARAIKTWLTRQSGPANLIVVPVDMPALGPAQLKHLIAQPGGAFYRDLYLPFYAPGAHAAQLTDNMVRMRDVLSALQLTALRPPTAWQPALMNVNTTEDLEALEQIIPD